MPTLSHDGKMRPTLLMERASRFVIDWIGDDLPTRNEIVKGVKGKDSAVGLAIDVLVEEGYLEETKDGESKNSARRFRSLKPYSSSLDPLSDTNKSQFNQPGGNNGLYFD